MSPLEQAGRAEAREVVGAVRLHMGVDLSTIRGRDRRRPVVNARWVLVLLLREQGLSYRAIGCVLRRGLSTVHYCLSRARERQALLLEADRVRPARNVAARYRDVDAELRRAREEAQGTARC